MHAQPRALVLVLVIAAVVAACSPAGDAPATSEPPDDWAGAGNLAGRTFLSTAIDGYSLVPGSRVRLTFDVGQIGAQAGCNTMSGPTAIVDGRLALGGLAMTEMACEIALMDQDAWLAAFLDGAAIGLAGDTLTLAKDGITLTLVDRELADPDRPLVGTRWVVDGFVAGDAVSSAPAGVVASLTFGEGRVAVEAGCNTGGAPVTVEPTAMSFGPLVLTEMACQGAAAAVEQAVTATLVGTAAYAIEADVLTLTAGPNGLILRAAP